MSSVINIPWKSVDYGIKATDGSTLSPKTLEGTLSNLACIDAEKGTTPILLFIESRGYTKDGMERIPTKNHQLSTKAYQAIFHNTLGRISSSMFKCLRMDITAVTKAKSKYLCHQSAPMVVIFHKNGLPAKIFKDRSLSSINPVYSTMCKVMRSHKVDLNAKARAVMQELDTLYKNEIKLYGLDLALRKEKERYRTLKNKSTAEAEALKKAQSDYNTCKKTSNQIIEKCKKLASMPTT